MNCSWTFVNKTLFQSQMLHKRKTVRCFDLFQEDDLHRVGWRIWSSRVDHRSGAIPALHFTCTEQTSLVITSSTFDTARMSQLLLLLLFSPYKDKNACVVQFCLGVGVKGGGVEVRSFFKVRVRFSIALPLPLPLPRTSKSLGHRVMFLRRITTGLNFFLWCFN